MVLLLTAYLDERLLQEVRDGADLLEAIDAAKLTPKAAKTERLLAIVELALSGKAYRDAIEERFAKTSR